MSTIPTTTTTTLPVDTAVNAAATETVAEATQAEQGAGDNFAEVLSSAETEDAADESSPVSTSIQETEEQFSTFLRLLTAQIKNQDPLAPLDSTQFVEQLATFSNLELQASGNQSLEEITSLLKDQSELLANQTNITV